MTEPVFGGIPLSLVLLYFVFYSFAGWGFETLYCSLKERRYVPRGFLFGPVCPIYGVGALLMLLFFQPFVGNPVLFYAVSTVVMSAWEYFVGWFLETTTHMKYWDYSMYRFNLKGRICLWVCLFWGVLSYLTLFVIHPPVAELFSLLTPTARYALCGITLTLMAVDAAVTIRKLALTAVLMARLETAHAELADARQRRRKVLDARAAFRRDAVEEKLDAGVAQLTARYEALLARAEQQSRRFRARYRNMSATRFTKRFQEVKRLGSRLKDRIHSRRED